MKPFLTLHDPVTAKRYYEQGLWAADTFYSLMSYQSETRPQAEALRDGRHILNWQALKVRVDAMAGALYGSGIHAGDRISIWMDNRIATYL